MGQTVSAVDTVHIVDDDPAVGDSMCVLLAAYGIEAVHHGSAEALLGGTWSFDGACLIVDVHLRDMGGIELVKRLRAEGIRAPVVLMSGNMDPNLIQRAEMLGVVGVMSKPLDAAGLLELLDRAGAAPD